MTTMLDRLRLHQEQAHTCMEYGGTCENCELVKSVIVDLETMRDEMRAEFAEEWADRIGA